MRARYLALLLACVLAEPAGAEIVTSVKVETYPVAGDNGDALLRAMDKHGPKQGFLARAVAQTRYGVDWKIHWQKTGGGCRPEKVEARLSIAYRYPDMKGRASSSMTRKWATFMKGVRAHEQTHGRLAQQMVAAAHKAVVKVRFDRDPGCRKAQREVARRIDVAYAEYEGRQNRFDAIEHAPGGHVDQLVDRLVRRGK